MFEVNFVTLNILTLTFTAVTSCISRQCLMASLSCVAHELKFGKKLVHRNSNVCSISGWLAESQQIQSKGNILQ